MILHVVEARYLSDYVLWLKFNDGLEGEVDLEDELCGEVFEPLKNIREFRKVRLHPDLRTIAWENGADIDPDVLYYDLKPAWMTENQGEPALPGKM